MAKPNSAASVWSVATRLNARTFEYESSPRSNAASMRGNPHNALATRTFSCAVTRDIPHFQFSHSAQSEFPYAFQPCRRSNSRSRMRNRCVAFETSRQLSISVASRVSMGRNESTVDEVADIAADSRCTGVQYSYQRDKNLGKSFAITAYRRSSRNQTSP